MGVGASSEMYEDVDAAPPPASGYRVLSVEPASPATTLLTMPDAAAARTPEGRAPRPSQLIAYLDVIVSINGILLDADAEEAGE